MFAGGLHRLYFRLQVGFRSAPRVSHSGTQTERVNGGNSSPGKWQEHKRQANHARMLKALLISCPLAFHWLKQAKAKDNQWGVDFLSGKPQQGQRRKAEFCTNNATCHPQVAQEVPLCHENIPALGTRPGCHRISRQCRDRLGSGSSPMTFLLLNTIFLYRSYALNSITVLLTEDSLLR